MKKLIKTKPRNERQWPQVARCFSTNFLDKLLSHTEKCFVPLEDYQTLEKKYIQLFKRYEKTKLKSERHLTKIEVIQVFKGTVHEISDTTFQARLEDLTKPSNSVTIVEILLEKFPHVKNYKIGSMFTMSIGCKTFSDNTEESFSSIFDIDLGVWTQREIDEALESASQYEDFFSHNTQ